MGSGSVAIAVGLIGSALIVSPKNKRTATGQTIGGSWDSPVHQPESTTSVHAALLAGGKVFWIQGSGNHGQYIAGPFKHGIWNPDGTFLNTNSINNDDLFCCGMATLANGNILLSGGTYLYDGPIGYPRTSPNGRFCGAWFAYEVNFNSGSIGTRTEMRHGRWYPTCVELPDGKVCVMQGLDEYGVNNRLVEYYDPADKSWTLRLDPTSTRTWCAGVTQESYDFSPLPPPGSRCYGPGTAPYLPLYPRMHLLPSGLIACVGWEPDDRLYDPNTFKWVFANSGNLRRHYGTSVLCPLENTSEERGKILLAGGSPTAADPPTNSCQIVEPTGTNGITRRSIQSMQFARKYADPVILPSGEIAIFGGNDQGISRLTPEVFNYVNESWRVWNNARVPRSYHQVSLLLQDGRVWTAGTTPNKTTLETRVEVFNPWYVSENRPVISGEPSVGSYNETITVPTPDASRITKVSLIKQSSVTHHYNTDQRLIWLQIVSKTDSTVTVKAPINSKLAPPGVYLIHILDDSANPVPSTGTFIQVPGTGDIPPPVDTTSPSQVTGVVATVVSNTQIDLTWTANNEADLHHYNIYRSQTAGFSVVPGTDAPVAQGTTNSHSDTGLAPAVTYYYKVAAVDVAGNIGELSNEAAGTTNGSGYVSVYSVAGANNYAKMNTGGIIRAGEFLQSTSTTRSAMIGTTVKKLRVHLRRSGNPTGTVRIVIRSEAGTVVHTFGTIDTSTLTTTDQAFEREATSPFVLLARNRILIEWDGTGSKTDQVWVKKSASVSDGGFDKTATVWTQYTNRYANQATYDLAGEWYEQT